MKEKFTKVRVLCSKENLSPVLAVLLGSKFVSEPADAKMGASLGFKHIDGDNPYETPLKHLRSVAKYAGWDYILPEKAIALPDNFSEETEQVYNKYKKFKRDKLLLLEQKEECEEGKQRIRLFGKLPVDLQTLTECEFVKARFGHIPKDCLNRLLQIYKSEPFVEFFKSYESETDCWGIYLVPRDNAERIDSIFASLLFEPVNIPSASGDATRVEEQIDKNIEILDRQILKTNALEEYYFKMKFDFCNELYSLLSNEFNKYEILKNGLVNGSSYILCGLLPCVNTGEIEKELRKIDGAFLTQLNTVKIKAS